MNLPITIKDDVRPDISCCVKDWINKAGAWSQARYDFVDFEKDVTISIEKLPEDMSGQWAVWQPQKYPYPIRISELDRVNWKVEAKEKYWLTSSYYYTGPQIAYEVATVSLFTGVTYTLGPESYRESWDRLWTPQTEQYEYLVQNYPELIKSWTDRSNWLIEHVRKIPHHHWSFPPVNKKLCRSGNWGSGARWPEGVER